MNPPSLTFQQGDHVVDRSGTDSTPGGVYSHPTRIRQVDGSVVTTNEGRTFDSLTGRYIPAANAVDRKIYRAIHSRLYAGKGVREATLAQ